MSLEQIVTSILDLSFKFRFWIQILLIESNVIINTEFDWQIFNIKVVTEYTRERGKFKIKSSKILSLGWIPLNCQLPISDRRGVLFTSMKFSKSILLSVQNCLCLHFILKLRWHELYNHLFLLNLFFSPLNTSKKVFILKV